MTGEFLPNGTPLRSANDRFVISIYPVEYPRLKTSQLSKMNSLHMHRLALVRASIYTAGGTVRQSCLQVQLRR